MNPNRWIQPLLAVGIVVGGFVAWNQHQLDEQLTHVASQQEAWRESRQDRGPSRLVLNRVRRDGVSRSELAEMLDARWPPVASGKSPAAAAVSSTPTVDARESGWAGSPEAAERRALAEVEHAELLDATFDAGVLTVEQGTRLAELMPHLDRDTRLDVRSQIVLAINDGQLELEGPNALP